MPLGRRGGHIIVQISVLMIKLKQITCDQIEKCPVPKFYKLMGKKWVFPILCRIRDDEDYRFEDIIQISRKNIHRTTLSNLLKELITMNILEKKKRYYKLTHKGKQIKKDLIKISQELLHPNTCSEIN